MIKSENELWFIQSTECTGLKLQWVVFRVESSLAPGDWFVAERSECLVDEPCQNGASCDDTRHGYICHCKPGFTGRNCTGSVIARADLQRQIERRKAAEFCWENPLHFHTASVFNLQNSTAAQTALVKKRPSAFWTTQKKSDTPVVSVGDSGPAEVIIIQSCYKYSHGQMCCVHATQLCLPAAECGSFPIEPELPPQPQILRIVGACFSVTLQTCHQK